MIYIIIVLAVLLILSWIKIALIYKSLDQIVFDMEEAINKDINIAFRTSSNDKHFLKFTDKISKLLDELKQLRHKYTKGDEELKTAIINISHDLRTPLTAISGYIDLINEEKLTENTKEYIDVIDERTKTLQSLTEELFRYSTVLGLNEESFNDDIIVNDVLEECIAGLYGALTKRGIEPDISICEKKIMIKGNHDALVRAFSNILSNALKYSEGDLCVIMDEEGKIVFSNRASNIDATQLGKLFDRFYTVEDGRKSTGLGLSIAKNYIERMNGTIKARYAEGRLEIIINY